jgi:histidinol-phosphate aminotransferase
MIPRRSSYQGISLYSPPTVQCRIDLSDNTNLFGMPPAAEQALRDFTPALVTRYPVSYAPELKKALSIYSGFESSWLTTGCFRRGSIAERSCDRKVAAISEL